MITNVEIRSKSAPAAAPIMVGVSKPVTGIGGIVAEVVAVKIGVELAVAVGVGVGVRVGSKPPKGVAVGLAKTKRGLAVGLWAIISVMVYEPVLCGVSKISLPSLFLVIILCC